MINKIGLKGLEETENDKNNDNQKEKNSSFENISGEEEDEDDLLKSDSISNNSCKSFRGYIDDKLIMKKNNKEDVPILGILLTRKLKELKNKETTDNNNNNKNDNNNNNKEEKSSNNSSEKEAKRNEDDTKKDTLFDFSLKEEEEDEKDKEDDEDDENDDEDDDKDEIEDEEVESESASISPYIKYKNSEVIFKNFFYHLDIDNVVYEKKSNKYYIYMGKLYGIDNKYLFINFEVVYKVNCCNIINNIKKKYIKKTTNNDRIVKEIINQILNEINIRDNLVSEKKEENGSKLEIIVLNNSDNNILSTTKKIKIYYLNYLNKKYSFYVLININWTSQDLQNFLMKLYHFPQNITFIIKNIKNVDFPKKEKIFHPDKFDYEKDYVLLLEHENLTKTNIDLGSNNSKYNFKGEKVPHIVFSSYYNFCVESMVVSNKLNYLECEVYMFKDEYYFNLERNVGIYNLKKAKEALSSSDWKNKCNYVTTIKSIKTSKYKNNDDAISFEIYPQLIIYHDKSYVFSITSPNLNINTFSSGSGDQGLFIVSFDDKAILNGFICIKISDLALENQVIS
jgi:hypothetical protein